MRVRSYGTLGPQVVVLHGGPGAPGHMAPVARGLADSFRIIEPFQRGSGTEPLTVSRHVGDLHEVIQFRCGTGRPALVGSSWGAMLALCYAAEHPQFAGPLVLIGCGTFDRVSRARMQETLHDRMDENLRWQLERLTSEFAETIKRHGTTWCACRKRACFPRHFLRLKFLSLCCTVPSTLIRVNWYWKVCVPTCLRLSTTNGIAAVIIHGLRKPSEKISFRSSALGYTLPRSNFATLVIRDPC